MQIPSYSFLLEVVIKFNTCHYHKGNLIQNRLQIAKTYIKSSKWVGWGHFFTLGFLIDIIVVIPFFLSLQFNIPYLDLVIVLKIFQISKLVDSLFDRLELSQA